MNTRLIIVDGHSSVGKSSVSKSLHRQIALSRPTYWLHEECENHPIRQGEFSFGALETAEGMEANRSGMLAKWAAFCDAIQASGQVCVTEGCLLHAYDRYFIHSLWEDEQIAAYYAQVVEVIRSLDPILVFLHRPDLRRSLEKAFTARGAWWRELMLRRDDRHVYFKDHSYVDENSMYAAIAFEQEQMMAIYDRLDCAKIRIDTSAEQWERYVAEIIEFAGLPYANLEQPAYDPQRYTGAYRWRNGAREDEWVIQYDPANRCLYSTLFWPYMPMRCVAADVFELISFPVELRFEDSGDRIQFHVRGNYDWEYNDEVFERA
jgi:hypothetical protein